MGERKIEKGISSDVSRKKFCFSRLKYGCRESKKLQGQLGVATRNTKSFYVNR